MTAEQEAKEDRRSWVLFVTSWAQFFLLIILFVTFVYSCRQADKLEFRELIESVKCTCDRQVTHTIDQQVNVMAPDQQSELAYKIWKQRHEEAKTKEKAE